MSSPSMIAVRDDSFMNNSSPGPRSSGPSHRRPFTPTQNLNHLTAYKAAIGETQGGAYLRQAGIYSSQIT